MTREEAIEYLKILKEDYWDDDGYGHETKKYDDTMLALDMAIKALEQEPVIRHNEVKDELNHVKDELESTTKNDLGVDCISRQAVLELIADNDLSMGQVVRGIHALPSVTPQEPRWIPLTKRPMTDEEREHYFEYTDMRIDDTYTILDCPLPDDGQEVLVSWGGNVGNDVFIQDNEGCYFEGMDIDEVDAWMPLPKPYSEVEV